MFRGLGDESWDSAVGVQPVHNINQTLFFVGGFASADVDDFGNASNIVHDISMCHL